MVVWSRSKGDSGDSPATTPSCRERLREERVLLLTDFCTFVEFSRSCELLWWCCWSLCTSGSPILISLRESWDSPLVSGSVGGGAIMCRCSWEREGGAPWVECGGGGLVEGWVGNRVNIKCWQATKPRQPQRKEEMSGSEGKEEIGRRILARFLQLWQHPAANARCGGIKGVWLAFCF